LGLYGTDERTDGRTDGVMGLPVIWFKSHFSSRCLHVNCDLKKFLFVYILLWCFPRIYFRSSTFHRIYTIPLRAIISSLSLTTTFT